MDVPFVWVDVFADAALTGNPLALVPNADDLSEPTMRAIAREFNQSETTFLVAPNRGGADHRLRSFTPAGVEVLGAGHNAMGAWIWLVSSGRLPTGRTAFAQQIGDDVLPVSVTWPDGAHRPLVSMDQAPAEFIRRVGRRADLAAALRLEAEDLDAGRNAEVVSTGAAHLLVPLVSRAAVDSAVPNHQLLLEFLADSGAEGCYLYSLKGDADAYTRFFNPTVGIAEDPATGTAAGPLAALLVRDGIARQRELIIIEQGTVLGRPSRLEVTVDGSAVRLSGSGVVAAEGVLHV